MKYNVNGKDFDNMKDFERELKLSESQEKTKEKLNDNKVSLVNEFFSIENNSELHPDRYGGDSIYECKKVWEAWTNEKNDGYEETVKNTLIKYLSRFGKKDEKLKEAEKIFNYAKFLLEYEIKKSEK